MTVVVSPTLHREVGLDLDKLIAPLADGDGGGEDIRYTPVFDAIAEARREDSDDGDQGIWQTDLKKGDWKAVVKQGGEILATRSKDLQVTVWMIQALVRLHGLKGLVAGLDLLARLVETFWPVLHPRIAEDDMDFRLGPFFWLDTHLTSELVQLEVSEPMEGRRRGLDYQQIIKARQLRRIASNDPRAYEDALSDGELPPEQTEDIMAETSDGFFEQRHADARQALLALGVLRGHLDTMAGEEAPSFARLTASVQDLERLFAGVLHSRGLLSVSAATPDDEDPSSILADEPDADEAAAEQWTPEQAVAGLPATPDEDGHLPAEGGPGSAAPPAATDQGGAPSVGAQSKGRGGWQESEQDLLSSRRAAYRVINQAAEWLLRHEPHSPAPYLIKRAAAWENMSLRDVLAELLARGGDLETVMELLGMDSEGRPAGGRTRKDSSVLDE